MRYIYLSLLACSLLLSACQGEEGRLLAEITRLEKELQAQEQPSDSVMRPLIVNYLRYAKNYSAQAQAGVFLYRTAELFFRVNNFNETVVHLETILREHKENLVREQSLLFAAMVYEERLNIPNRAGELYKLYLEEFPEGEGKAKAEFFFKPLKERLHIRIDEWQEKLTDGQRGNINSKAGLELLAFYRELIKKFPDDEKSPKHCYDAGLLAKNLGEPSEALFFLQHYIESYQDEEQYPDALFSLAVTYDNDMTEYKKYYNEREDEKVRGDFGRKARRLPNVDYKKEAERLYKEFLAKYPEHRLRPLAEQSLQYLYKDPSELVEQFAQKQKERKKATEAQ